MTAPRPEQALLARLVDEVALESEPIEEVRADLAVFGIDPAPSIRLARRLAAGSGSPAGRLLGRIAEAESLDEELRRLEQADIAGVHGQLPPGDTAAAVAHAHRASGRDSNVVDLRRRRSRRLTYGLSGMAAALAASLVFYVGVSLHQQESSRLGRSAFAPGPPAGEDVLAQAPSTADAPDETRKLQRTSDELSQTTPVASVPTHVSEPESAAPSVDDVQARMQPAASAPEPLIERRATDTETSMSKSVEADSAAAPDAPATERASSPEVLPEVQAGDGALADGQPYFMGGAADAQRQDLTGDMSANVISTPFGIERPVLALLVVDSGLVPEGLRERQYPEGNLATRLAEARRLTAGLPIVALVTLQYDDGPRDAVVLRNYVFRQQRDTPELGNAAEESEAWHVPTAYEVRLLDRR